MLGPASRPASRIGWGRNVYSDASRSEKSSVNSWHPEDGRKRPPAQVTIARPSVSPPIKRSGEGKGRVEHSVERPSQSNREHRHAINPLSYPLTRQEELLLQFARNARPADLQALNPEDQAKVEAQQEAEFAAYLKSGSSSDTESATQTPE